jgi:hypothetical protein
VAFRILAKICTLLQYDNLLNIAGFAGFEVIAVVLLKIQVFWDVMPWRLVGSPRNHENGSTTILRNVCNY